MLVDTGRVPVTVPMLRGVWGRALHAVDSRAYDAVFHPGRPDRLPGYVLRPAPADPAFAPALEFVLIGEAVRFDQAALRAWGVASGMGVGWRGDRQPFCVRRRLGKAPDGQLAPVAKPWPLGEASWPGAGDPASSPCRLRFVTPLSIVHDHALVQRPTLTDGVAKACRRVRAFLPPRAWAVWDETKARLIAMLRDIPAEPWCGERLDLKRYSGAQKRAFHVPGVPGWIDLPDGPGPLWPLLAAIQWIHVGKSTSVGLGQLVVELPWAEAVNARSSARGSMR